MKHAGTISFHRQGQRVVMTIQTKDVIHGLGQVPGMGVRSVHFGTKLRGYNIKKGQGYGWDGADYITARKIRGGWQMTIPVRDNDPKNRNRRFIKGNAYIRSHHNEIFYFDPQRWAYNPPSAYHADGMGGQIMELDLEAIPKKR